jgi:hypothetical protein
MAPRAKAKNPAEQIEALERLKEEKEAEHDAAQIAKSHAYDLLGIAEGGPNIAHPGPPRPPADGSPTIPERLKAAKDRAELGRDHHESLEAICAARDELHTLIGTCQETIEDKTGAIGTLADEIAELEAEHRDFFIADAEQGSREGAAQLDKLLAVFDETKPLLMEMWSRWTRVKIGIATNDVDHLRLELVRVKETCCWPAKCGSEQQWQALKAREQGQPRARPSNREAIAQFEGRAT